MFRVAVLRKFAAAFARRGSKSRLGTGQTRRRSRRSSPAHSGRDLAFVKNHV
jgi:hypothetical protein